MNSKGDNDLNLKPELPKPLDKNMGSALEDIWVRKGLSEQNINSTKYQQMGL